MAGRFWNQPYSSSHVTQNIIMIISVADRGGGGVYILRI